MRDGGLLRVVTQAGQGVASSTSEKRAASCDQKKSGWNAGASVASIASDSATGPSTASTTSEPTS